MPTIPAPSTKVLQEIPRKDISRYVNVQPGSLIQGNRVTQRRGLKKKVQEAEFMCFCETVRYTFLICARLRFFAPICARLAPILRPWFSHRSPNFPDFQIGTEFCTNLHGIVNQLTTVLQQGPPNHCTCPAALVAHSPGKLGFLYGLLGSGSAGLRGRV